MAKEKKNVYTGTGHRKTSVARVTLTPGKGKITVNGRDVREYFPSEICIMDLTQPLVLTNTNEMFDVDAKVMREQYPTEMMERAVKGMLPHNRLGRQMSKKLFVYAGSEHKQMAQKPEVLELK